MAGWWQLTSGHPITGDAIAVQISAGLRIPVLGTLPTTGRRCQPLMCQDLFRLVALINRGIFRTPSSQRSSGCQALVNCRQGHKAVSSSFADIGKVSLEWSG